MPKSIEALAQTIQAMRPMLPAKDFARSVKFYVDLGFQQRTLTDGLAEMTLGACSFLLQDYYVREWADNLVIHLFVSDLDSWWAHIVALDLSIAVRREDESAATGRLGCAGRQGNRSVWCPLEIPRSSQCRLTDQRTPVVAKTGSNRARPTSRPSSRVSQEPNRLGLWASNHCSKCAPEQKKAIAGQHDAAAASA